MFFLRRTFCSSSSYAFLPTPEALKALQQIANKRPLTLEEKNQVKTLEAKISEENLFKQTPDLSAFLHSRNKR